MSKARGSFVMLPSVVLQRVCNHLVNPVCLLQQSFCTNPRAAVLHQLLKQIGFTELHILRGG